MDRYETVARSIAWRAGQIMKKNFQLGMDKSWKSDCSPLTASDTAINELVTQILQSEFPSHGLVSEESAVSRASAEFIWVCDPIDGTLPFSHGIPIATFSLALTQKGQVILGIIFDPFSNRLFFARLGQGATLGNDKHQPEPIHVSDQTELRSTAINAEGLSHGLWGLPKEIEAHGARCTNFYSILYSAALVAAGQLPAIVLASSNPWDAAAAKVIVEEAGGRVTDLDGNDQRYDRQTKGMIASNGRVHDQLLEIVAAVRSAKTT